MLYIGFLLLIVVMSSFNTDTTLDEAIMEELKIVR
jgi:hypothetical protein